MSKWWAYLAAVFAVPAILAGLIAMHFLAGEPRFLTGHSASVSSVAGAGFAGTGFADAGFIGATYASASIGTMAMAPDATLPASADECGLACGPNHEQMAMACILVLLLSTIVVAIHLFVVRGDARRATAVFTSVFAAYRARARAPSLHVLSISRT